MSGQGTGQQAQVSTVNLVVGTNSYVDVLTAQAYFDNRLFSDVWNNASTDDKSRALIMATGKINRLPIKGVKANYQQTMEFPRALETDYRYWQYMSLTIDAHFYGYWYVEPEVTQNVKNAVCEEALALLKGIPKRVELQRQGVKSFNLGGMSENYGSGKNMPLYSQEAKEFMQPYFGSVNLA